LADEETCLAREAVKGRINPRDLALLFLATHPPTPAIHD